MSHRDLRFGALRALALGLGFALLLGAETASAQGTSGDVPRTRPRADDAYRPSPDEVAGPFRSRTAAPAYGAPAEDRSRGDFVERGPLPDAAGGSPRQAYEPPRAEDAYRPPAPYRDEPLAERAQSRPYATPPGAYDESTYRPPYRQERYAPPPPDAPGYQPPPRDPDGPRDGTYSMREIQGAGHSFFGALSQGLASTIEYAFRKQGRPNGYILGEDVGGAFVAGLRYGRGWLYTRDAGQHPVYWQGPSIGWDAGAEGSKVMVLVYRLRDPADIYRRFGGVAGSAYVVGGVGLTFQIHDDIVLAPIRTGVGLRLGANIGYLKYTRRPTWNPF